MHVHIYIDQSISRIIYAGEDTGSDMDVVVDGDVCVYMYTGINIYRHGYLIHWRRFITELADLSTDAVLKLQIHTYIKNIYVCVYICAYVSDRQRCKDILLNMFVSVYLWVCMYSLF